MATPYESATLLLTLYDQRREATMRAARNFMVFFDPKSPEDYMAAMMGPESAHLRMVSSYWEMAASLVVHGAIDPALFNEANGEHLMVFGKVEPFLQQLRDQFGPTFLKNLEKVCLEAPGGLERVRMMRERMRAMLSQASRANA